MEIGRDEMGSEKGEENVVKCVNTSTSVNRVKLDNIEEWLLVEVLIRLPVKFVFRFKLVCKQWLSIISDPSFMLIYVSRASIFPQSQSWTFISHIMYINGSQGLDFAKDQLLGDIYSRDIKPPSVHIVRCPSAQHQDTGKYTIVGVSNGLVLYGQRVDRGYFFSYLANYTICNPITGQWTGLPPHNRSFKHACSSFVAHVENNILKSYRVVHLNTLLKSSNIITFEVFSSETGEWNDVVVNIDIEIQFLLQWNPTSLNGTLHWITRRHGLIAYDPYHKPDSVRIIALPGDSHPACMRIFYVHHGRLRYFKMACTIMPHHETSTFSLWVLNDYTTGDWSLQHRITPSDIIYDGIFPSQKLSLLQPVSFHPFDSDIVYLRYKNIFVSYNIKTRKLEAHGDPLDIEGYCNNMPFWRSPFIIPPWPICIPSTPFGVED